MTEQQLIPATFEESLALLEAAVARLESGELSLAEALACFEQGVAHAGRCQQTLSAAHLQVERLTSGADGTLSCVDISPAAPGTEA